MTIGERLPGAIERMTRFLGSSEAFALPVELREDLTALLVGATAYGIGLEADRYGCEECGNAPDFDGVLKHGKGCVRGGACG